MKPAINYSSASRNAPLPRLGLLMLLCAAVLLSGCKSFGPIGAPDFDPTYSLTLEKNEQLLFSAQVEFVNGTYMEGEMEIYPSYGGVLLLTSERMLFAQWNEKQQRYEPFIWTGYSYIDQVKMHNNNLMQYIAVALTDGSKYTYMLGTESVERAYAILMENIRKNHMIPIPAV
jgi:hypothetical protein